MLQQTPTWANSIFWRLVILLRLRFFDSGDRLVSSAAALLLALSPS